MPAHAARPFRLTSLVALAALAACSQRQPPAPAAAEPGLAKVLATVNGVPITELDVSQRAGRAMGGSAGGAPGHEPSPNVLRTVVREELAYQKAVQLGLDREPEYRLKIEAMEAQLRAFKRQEMGVRLRGWAQGQAPVTEAEARAWFDANAALLRTRFHVLQIMHKGQLPRALEDLARLKGGAPFEEVAAAGGAPAAGQASWDLGELHWSQLPPAWRGIVDTLEPGQVSDVIQGEGGRAWIVKLVGKRVDPAVDFAGERDRIVEQLRMQKAEALQAGLAKEVDGPGVVWSR